MNLRIDNEDYKNDDLLTKKEYQIEILRLQQDYRRRNNLPELVI